MTDSKKTTETLKNAASEVEDDELAVLQRRYDDLRDRHLEERFIWICGLVILLDAWWFSSMETWGGPIALLTLELPLLLVIGRQCQVEELDQIVNRLLDGWSRHRR